MQFVNIDNVFVGARVRDHYHFEDKGLGIVNDIQSVPLKDGTIRHCIDITWDGPGYVSGNYNIDLEQIVFDIKTLRKIKLNKVLNGN